MTDREPVKVMDLNRKQRRALRMIVKAALGFGRYDYPGSIKAHVAEFPRLAQEIKQLRIVWLWKTPAGGAISVVVEAGHKKDEKDMRSIYCRRHGHFRVGERGGIEALGYVKKGSKVKAQKSPLIFGFGS